MAENEVPDFRQYVAEWSEDLELLRQNWLLNEGRFAAFAKDRGVPVSGAITGNPGEFSKRGWLTNDGTDYDGSPLFHPFRIYPFHRTLEACALRMAPVAPLQRDSVLRIAEKMLSLLPSSEHLSEIAQPWNSIVDLAVLLEPIYWPLITGRLSIGLGTAEKHEAQLEKYRKRALHLVESLNPDFWRKQHESLRIEAAWMDNNTELYLLLRLSTWDPRKELTGRISGALWIRHLAEVLRRAFENVHGGKWLEEDQAFGTWLPGGREREFGSQRPLDDVFRSKPYLAHSFGLFTGSSVRWFVEGPTEYYAVAEMLPEPSKFSIELVNLHGVIALDKDNIALKLGAWLGEDKALRRFSIISFDRDVGANEKIIRLQVERGNVVGFIAAHKPDFEFANFTIGELVEIAARLDEAHGISGGDLRNSDWTGISGGRQFEKKYEQVSARGSSGLKGEQWGRALARYAFEHPYREDNRAVRSFVAEMRAALNAWSSNYDYQKEQKFDPDTFELIDPRTSNARSGSAKGPAAL